MNIYLQKSHLVWKMLGFQPGESDDSDKSSPSASPLAKRQKVSPVIDSKS